MILNYSEIMAMGFRIGRDIPEETVKLAIESAELYYIQPSMKPNDFSALCDMDGTAVLIAGGMFVDEKGDVHHIAGLKKGIGLIAYAELLRMNIAATTFGSVQKNDEYSTNVDPKEHIKYYLNIGLQYVREVCVLAGYEYKPVTGINRETYYTSRRKEGQWR